MSYRSFKRLLGESSLERKSRFLFGAVTLALISGSFWLYAKFTASLAYEATANSSRLLASQVLYNYHVDNQEARTALEAFQESAEKRWGDALSGYSFTLYKPHSRNPQFKFKPEEKSVLDKFIDNPNENEVISYVPAENQFLYYSAVRMTKRCLACHQEREKAEFPSLSEGQLYAVVRIKLDSRAIEEGAHLSRALLISCALVTSLLIMTGSWVIVRYVIVKPVKHLKEVSDAVSAGYLNVRSEIHTGDEFEDLSYAFNRMLRNLVTVQDELRETNKTLDHKVDELAQANMALYESNRLKSDFLATMSHELRTPLHSILGFSDLLLQAVELTDKQQRWVRNIRTSGAQLLDLINDILELARIEAGKLEVHPEEFDVGDLLERTSTALRPLAEKKNLDLRINAAENMPLVFQDPGKLQQILSNLLSNAIKFTPEGGRVEAFVLSEKDELVLTVSDTGVGIAPEDQEVIFDKFRQATANPLTREHEGTGLGLSIVRELAKLLGGDVTLQSELGRGSTFIVRLPRRIGSSVREEKAPEAGDSDERSQ